MRSSAKSPRLTHFDVDTVVDAPMRRTRRIVVLTDRSPQQQFPQLAHDLAHAALHGKDEHHTRSTKEVEAEHLLPVGHCLRS